MAERTDSLKTLRKRCSVMGSALLAGALAGCGGGSGGSGTSVTLRTYRSATPANAQFVAFRDGDGAWTSVAPTGAGQYTRRVSDPDGRYSFACVSLGPETRVYVVEATLAELSAPEADLGEAETGHSVSGSVAALGAGDIASVSVARRSGSSAGGAYRLDAVPSGEWDLVALRAAYPGGEMAVDRAFVRRSVSVRGDVVAPVDFATGADTEAYAVSVANRSADASAVARTEVSLHTAGQTRCAVGLGGGDGVYAALPAGLQLGGDTYIARGYEDLGAAGLSRRSRTQSFQLPGPILLTLGQALTGALLDSGPCTGAACRYVARWQAMPGAQAYDILLGQFDGAALIWECVVTASRLAGSNAYATPDLTGATGWQQAWSLGSGEVEWSVEGYQASPSIGAAMSASLRGPVPSGLDIISASLSGTRSGRAWGRVPMVRRFLSGLWATAR